MGVACGASCDVALENEDQTDLKIDPSSCGQIYCTFNDINDVFLQANLNESQKYNNSIDCIESTCRCSGHGSCGNGTLCNCIDGWARFDCTKEAFVFGCKGKSKSTVVSISIPPLSIRTYFIVLFTFASI